MHAHCPVIAYYVWKEWSISVKSDIWDGSLGIRKRSAFENERLIAYIPEEIRSIRATCSQHIISPRMECDLVNGSDEIFTVIFGSITMTFKGEVLLKIVSRFPHFFWIKRATHIELTHCNSTLCAWHRDLSVIWIKSNMLNFMVEWAFKSSIILASWLNHWV